jgi:hypothetical protein
VVVAAETIIQIKVVPAVVLVVVVVLLMVALVQVDLEIHQQLHLLKETMAVLEHQVQVGLVQEVAVLVLLAQILHQTLVVLAASVQLLLSLEFPHITLVAGVDVTQLHQQQDLLVVKVVEEMVDGEYQLGNLQIMV